MSTALYRRYRSRRFADVIGQPQVVRTLLNEMRTGRLAHAYLFAGVRGTGKTSTARILARAVNCLEAEEGEPCNRCEACVEVLAGSAVDVLEIDAASNRGIDDVRDLRERVSYLPASLRRKVYIIDEAHMLTTDAWNAFLKTLEEPPAHVLFVLATTEPHKVPDTVRSRTQRFDFRRVSEAEIGGHLEGIARAEGAAIDGDAVQLLARAGQGSVRDALSLLEQVLAVGESPVTVAGARRALGLADPAVVGRLVDALGSGDPGAALQAVASAFDSGADAQQLLREVARLVRAAAFGAVGFPDGAGVHGGDAEVARRLAATRPARHWIDALELLSAAELNLRQPVDSRLQVELCLLRILHPEPVSPAGEVREDHSAATEPPPPVPGPQGAALLRTEGEGGVAAPDGEGVTRTVAQAPAMRAPGTRDAPPSAATVATVAPVDLEGWIAAWPGFIDAIRHRSASLGGLLRDCRPTAAGPGRLVIGALHDFHLGQIRERSRAELLAEVATAVAGVPVTIETELCGDPAERAGDPAAGRTTKAVLDSFSGSRLVGSRPREHETTDRPISPGDA